CFSFARGRDAARWARRIRVSAQVARAKMAGRDRLRLVTRAVRRRCPRCGTRGVWLSFTRMRPACPTCGLQLDRGESDYFYGAYMFNFVAAVLLAKCTFVIDLVLTWPSPPLPVLTYGTVRIAVLAPIVLSP